MKYSENIMRKVRGNLNLELDDTSRDGEIEVMSKGDEEIAKELQDRNRSNV